ncbi:ribonuclease H-like domain-containing protein [Chloroflexota bacterium]
MWYNTPNEVIALRLQPVEAFLDIETTGLWPEDCDITVVGIHIVDGPESRFVQLVGEEATADNILAALEGANVINTYNGSRFDLPVILSHLKLDLMAHFAHCDLMYHCWRCNLFGGLKGVERQLGIPRRLKDITGYEAVRLWWRYVNDYDKAALATLLEYNKEDVVNLKTLKEMLI